MNTSILIDCKIAVTFPYFGPVALRDKVNNPPGDILCSGIEGENFIEILMVKFPVDGFLDMRKVYYHPVCV